MPTQPRPRHRKSGGHHQLPASPDRLTLSEGSLHHFQGLDHRAIETALTQDLTYVWGPPGTGKTDLLAAVVEGAVKQGHRVLFAGPTKVAVDQALLRIAQRLEAHEGFTHGLVQRLGKVELPALDKAYGAFVDRDQIRARLSGELDTKRNMLLEKRKQWSALAERAEQRARLHDELGMLARQHEATTQRLNAATSSGPARWFKRATGADIPDPGEVAGLAATLHELEGRRLTTGQALDALGAATPHEREAARHLKQVNDLLDEVERALEEQDRVLKESMAVAATTLDGAIQRHIESGAFDTVVVDEAGMIPLPKAVAVAAMASARLVMVGDFRQLPAVTATESRSLKTQKEQQLYGQWYERDIFDAAGLISPAGHVVTSPKLVGLDTQYRMRSGICDLVNVVAYPDRPLKTGRADTPAFVSTAMTHPLILVDTAITGFASGTSAATFNPVHAAVTREVLRMLQADNVLPLRRSPDTRDALVRTLGIIAPYRDQVRRLEAQLLERFGEAPRGVVSTVHSFQGSERPVMILDTVAHTGSKDLGAFYRGVTLTSTTTRLLNVAASRAQDHLIVLADVNLLTSRADPASATHRLIDHLVRNAQVLRAEHLIPTRSASQLRSLSGPDSLLPAFFTADETPAAVEWDIRNAQSSVEIFCPFISRATLRSRMAELKAASARGLTVTLWTRAATIEDEAAAISELRGAGITVLGRDQMHEKLIVIDGTILWHGSYNYLAHTRATELMLRMVDTDAAKEAKATVERARPTKAASTWARRTHGGPPPGDDRVDLNVTYQQKDQAKALGAKWDPAAKRWWVTNEQMRSGQFDEWVMPADSR